MKHLRKSCEFIQHPTLQCCWNTKLGWFCVINRLLIIWNFIIVINKSTFVQIYESVSPFSIFFISFIIFCLHFFLRISESNLTASVPPNSGGYSLRRIKVTSLEFFFKFNLHKIFSFSFTVRIYTRNILKRGMLQKSKPISQRANPIRIFELR